jgi:hypothetical protein
VKISVLTGNQPRHLALICSMAAVASEVCAVIESPALPPSGKQPVSAILRRYFELVHQAEKEVFGKPQSLPSNVKCLPLSAGELGKVSLETLAPALDSDLIIVFGSSFIRAPLIDKLIEVRAVNLHIGISPYYRGSACNFWALYDGHPEFVGATVHMLGVGLDSGAILFHALPAPCKVEPFTLGMLAVAAGQEGLTSHIKDNTISTLNAVAQNKLLQLRLSRIADFNEAVAAQYLDNRLLSADQIEQRLMNRDMGKYVRPYVPRLDK